MAHRDARDGFHRTALHLAFLTGRLNTVELLLQYGADANAQDKLGQPAFAYAAPMDVVEATRLLLAHGANPNAQDVNGNAWLYYALFQHYPTSVIPELLAHGAAPNLPDKNGLTPFMLAQQQKRPDLVRLLKQYGAK
jgi:ankyrin repeat protein